MRHRELHARMYPVPLWRRRPFVGAPLPRLGRPALARAHSGAGALGPMGPKYVPARCAAPLMIGAPRVHVVGFGPCAGRRAGTDLARALC